MSGAYLPGLRAGINSIRGRLAVALAVAVVAIGAISANRYLALDRELTGAALARRAAIGSLAATALAEKFERLIDVGSALATRVRFQELVDAGRWGDAAQIMRRVPEDFPFLDRLFVTDVHGTLKADVPELPGVVGTNFAHRDWFKGVSRDWKPYISGLYRRTAEPRRNVIAVSVPIRGGGDRIAGVLVLQLRLEKFFDWAGRIDRNPASRILVVDGAWQAAFDSKSPVDERAGDPAPDPMVQRLAPEGADVRIVRAAPGGEDLVFGYAPASHRWGVATLEPASITFSSRDQLLRQILLDGAVIALCAVAAIVLGTVVVLQRRREESDRAHREERERMQTEQRAFLRQVIDLDRNFIFAKDREGRFTLVNQAVAEAYGTTVDGLIGKTDHDFNPDREEVEHFRRDDLEVMDGLKDKFIPEEKITDASGRVRWLQTVKRPITGAHGGADMILGVATDITERKRAEAALRRAHEMAKLAHIVTGPGGAFESWSDTLPGLIGMAPEVLPRSTRAWLELIHPADQAGFRAKAIEAGASGARADVEYRLRRTDGEWIHIRQAIEPLEAQAQAGAGGALHWFCTLQDVSAQKHAEQRIRGQLEHLNLLDRITRSIGERQDLRSIFQIVVRSLEDSLPIDFGCVCIYDSTANTLRVTSVGLKSEMLAHELTMDEQAAIAVDDNGLGRCVQGQLVYEPDIGQVRFPFPERLARSGMRSLVLAPLRSESRVFGVLVAARRESGAFSSVECEFLRQLSEQVALAAHQAQLYGSLQQAYDELRQTQQAAMQEERLRALGQMASGIAHDINNTLSPVSLYAESLLETEKNLSKRARGYLETIQRAVDDVAETVARMREFYRQREVQLELAPVDVNQVVQQVLDLTRVRWSDMPQQHGISIEPQTELTPGLPKIMGVESEIREALVNLVFNAVDAMPEGGALTLRTRAAAAAQDTGPASVVIEVADEGVGMDEETRRRCLEPFFTTKGERGTGLGLAMVFGVAQRHSAELEIDSAPGAGTSMRLVFAAATAAIAEPGQPAAALEVPSRLRLLLVDDDPLLLKSLRDALETDGHAVAAANGGEDGITAFRASLERGEKIDAVITDLGMPYVDGRQVASAVKEASPATPVILLTGWGRRLVADGEIPPHVDRVLAKPPKLREVREALAQLCRRAAS